MFAASRARSSQRDLLVDNVSDRLRLEADIVAERWQRLKEATVRVQNHKDAFRRECELIGEEKRALQADRSEFEDDVARRWPAAVLTEEQKSERIKLNVGGTIFETTAEVISKDRFSVLASLLAEDSPVAADPSGVYFFDRDGGLFQHIINFLRDDVLPEDNAVLRGLYTESSFYRLGLLRRSVEARFEMMMARAEQAAQSQQMGTLGYGGAMMGSPAMMMTQQQIAAAGQTAFVNMTGAGKLKNGSKVANAAPADGPSSSSSFSSSVNSTSAASSSFVPRTTPQSGLNSNLPSKLLRTRQPRGAATSLPDPFGFTSATSRAMHGVSHHVGIPGASFANTYRDDFGY